MPKILETSTKTYGAVLVREGNVVTTHVTHGKPPFPVGTVAYPTVSAAKRIFGKISSHKKIK